MAHFLKKKRLTMLIQVVSCCVLVQYLNPALRICAIPGLFPFIFVCSIQFVVGK